MTAFKTTIAALVFSNLLLALPLALKMAEVMA